MTNPLIPVPTPEERKEAIANMSQEQQEQVIMQVRQKARDDIKHMFDIVEETERITGPNIQFSAICGLLVDWINKEEVGILEVIQAFSESLIIMQEMQEDANE